MQDPNALLTTLSNMALKPEVTFDKLFQKLSNVELGLLAYQRLAPNPGKRTAGMDGKTLDGAGLQLLRDAIADLKASRYKPLPVRRASIPKPNGKHRPLGMPSFREKLLGTVLKLILEAISEPTFAKHSQGFRPDQSCHTALASVKREMQGLRWWVEGDSKGFFDHVNHETLTPDIEQAHHGETISAFDRTIPESWVRRGWEVSPDVLRSATRRNPQPCALK